MNKIKFGVTPASFMGDSLTKEGDKTALARIHAHLCGDGGLYQYASSEVDRKNRSEIVYFNTNQELIYSFRDDMKTLFGVNMTYSNLRSNIRVKSIRIANFLLQLSKFGTREWRVPSLFLKANDNVKISWIKAFCFDEGYVMTKRNIIRIKSMNHAGMKDIQELLDGLAIKSWITGQNCDKSWYLNIRKEGLLKEFCKTPSRQ